MDYAHPVYTRESVAVQARLPALSGPVTAYAGAYHGWGFHEDGCRSGVAAARAPGVAW
jgi:predicted NAD/FAD-binding protein